MTACGAPQPVHSHAWELCASAACEHLMAFCCLSASCDHSCCGRHQNLAMLAAAACCHTGLLGQTAAHSGPLPCPLKALFASRVSQTHSSQTALSTGSRLSDLAARSHRGVNDTDTIFMIDNYRCSHAFVSSHRQSLQLCAANAKRRCWHRSEQQMRPEWALCTTATRQCSCNERAPPGKGSCRSAV